MTTSSNPTTTTPSTPPPPQLPKPTQATPSTLNHRRRRSARVSKRDPIVAPGFGTLQDIHKVSDHLGLSVDAVKAVMESRGRGIRSSKRNVEEVEEAAPVSSAWADFMKEEGMESTTTSTTTKAETSTAAASSSKATSASTSRTYKLPLKPEWFQHVQEEVKKRASKKPKFSPDTESSGEGGVLVQTGTLDFNMIGRSKRPLDQPLFDFMSPTKLFATQTKIKTVISGCNANHILAIDSHDEVYGWGRNEANQLGSELPSMVPLPTKLILPQALNEIGVVHGAVGKSHTILLDASGQLWSCGYNKLGQCGIKNFSETVPNFRKCVIPADVTMVQVACGENFTVALSEEGHLYTCGSSEFGQLANGETGEYFVTASKLAFANCNILTKRSTFCFGGADEKTYGSADTNTKVVPLDDQDVCIGYIACGKHHAVAIEAENTQGTPRRVFTWGCGDYGCLGHGLQKDEYYPRLVASLSNSPGVLPVSASAGAHCVMALTNHGHVYYWGKHRSVGEATMRPTLLEALANNRHVVTHVGGGSQSVVCCTANAVTVSWGQGPHGELGYGPEKKSSSKPAFVSALDKCRVLDLACAYGTTVFVLKQDDEQDKAAIGKLPTVNEQEVLAALGVGATEHVAASGGRGRPKKR